MADRKGNSLISAWVLWSVVVVLCSLVNWASCATLEKQIFDSAPNVEMFDIFHVMPEGEVKVMTELDMLLSLDQYKQLYTKTTREKRKAAKDTAKRWSDCKVFYEITDSLAASEKLIKSAIKVWEGITCLVFYENKTISNRIQFKDGGGCYSELGMTGKVQTVTLARGCLVEGIVVHEIGHAIGWYHEHMRPDRDAFIEINYDAIPMMYHRNFMKYDSDVINTYGIPYDYGSIMHYGSSVLPGSIIVKDTDYEKVIGQRMGFSFKDIKLANVMYNCAEIMGCSLRRKCKFNGFVLYKSHKGSNICQCWCDSGNYEDPLVLCDNIDREHPGPDPSPTIQPPPVVDTCYDARPDCPEMKDEGLCMTKMEAMGGACKKTCGFCGKMEKMCMDHEKGCRIIAMSGACKDPALETILKDMCPASCGYCDKPPDMCEIQNEIIGHDSNNNSAWKPGVVAPVFLLVLISIWMQYI